jgi:hypothetical protein
MKALALKHSKIEENDLPIINDSKKAQTSSITHR